MFKIALLIWVITIIAYTVLHVQCKWMSTEEYKLYTERGIIPTRLIILAAFTGTSLIASITLTIIALTIG